MDHPVAASVKKLARALALSAVVLLVFLLSCVAAVVLHSNTPLVRALAAEQASRLLGAQFQGRIVIASLDHLSADQVLASRVEIQDAQGRALLVAQGVNAHFSLLGFAAEVLSAEDPMTLAVRHVRIEHVDVTVELDPSTGRTTLEQALSLKPTSGSGTGSGRPSRQLSLWFPVIELGEVQARVNLKNQSLNVRVSRAQGRVSVEPKGVSVDVDRFSTVLSGTALNRTALRPMTGTGAAHLQFPGTNQVEIQGALGSLDFSGRFRQRGNHLSLQVDVPHADPADITALYPGWPAQQAVEAHWRTTGSWPAFETDLDLTLADGSSLDAEGTLQMAPEPQAQLQIFAKDANLHSFVEAAPQTSFTVNGRLNALTTATGMQLNFSAATDATSVANQDVPRSDVTGSYDEHGLAVEGQLFEPDAPATFRFELSPQGAMTLHAQAQSVALGSWRFARDGVAGNASFTLDAKSTNSQLEWRLQMEVNRLQLYNFQAGHTSIEAHGTGSPVGILSTRGALSASGTDLRMGDLHFDRLELNAQGLWNHPQITATMNSGRQHGVEFSGSATLTPKLSFQDLRFRLNEQDLQLSGKISKLQPEGPVIEAEDLSLTGAGGTLSGWLRYHPGLIETNLSAHDLDLALLNNALGQHYPVRGRAQLQLDLTAGPDVARGSLAFTVSKASWQGVGSATAKLQALLNADDLSVNLSGIDPLVGAFGGQAQLHLGGSIFQRNALKEATGNAELQVDGIPLDPLSLAAGKSGPIRDMTGRAAIRLQVERPNTSALPDFFGEVTLSDLGFSSDLIPNAPLAFSHSTLRSTVSLNSRSGDLSTALSLSDSKGELLVASGTLQSDLPKVMESPEQAPSLLTNAPLNALVSLNARSLDALPIAISNLTGTVAARVTVRGTLADPQFAAMVSALSVRSSTGPDTAALDFMTHGEYTPKSSEITLDASVSHQGLRVASVEGQAHLSHDENGANIAGNGSLIAHLDDFPLQVVGPLADAGVHGSLSGALRLSASPNGVEMRAMLSPRGIGIPGANLGDGTLLLDGTQSMIHGELKLGSFPSTLDARILLGVAPEQYLNSFALDFEARQQEASLLEPFLAGLLSQLRGEIDAQAHLVMSRSAKTEPWTTSLDGAASLHSGIMHIDTLGLELRDIEGTALARSAGGVNAISITGVRAKARANDYNFVGDASLSLQGLRVSSGEAHLSIRDFPFMLEGVPKGFGTGVATATLTRKPSYMLAAINVGALDLRLPAGSNREVLEIHENPDFFILQNQATRAEQGGLPWRLRIEFGSRTRVLRNDVDLVVSGVAEVNLDKKASFSGNLVLEPGGRVQAMGKAFVIEHGTMTLNPDDPSNPTIDVRAAYRAPDGVSIYALAHGPIKELDSLQLSSDAGLSQDEIWQRIAGASSGVASADAGNGSNDSGNTASNAGLGVAALGVNEMLGSSLKDVELRVDPGESQSYTAAVRLNDKLWLEGRYQRDDTAAAIGGPSNVVSGAFDYRFARKWSLRTELGNAGGTFDLLWQHRY